MRWGTFIRVLFVIYCLEAGVFLLMAPWSPAWERVWIQLSVPAIHLFLTHTAVRGGISGFGLIHLVWSAHDLELLLSRRQRPREP